MKAVITPMDVGEIFDRTIKLFGRAFVPALVIAIIFVAPATLLEMIGMSGFYSSLGDMSREAMSLGPADIGETIGRLLGSLFLVMVTSFVAFVGYLIARMAIINLLCADIEGDPVSWQWSLREVFDMRILKGLGQLILEVLAYCAVVVFPYILIIAGAAAQSMGLMLFGVLGILGALLVILWLAVRWMFTTVAIAWEDSGAIAAFSRSSELVKGNWWRTFGILLLFWILLQIVTMIVVTPVFLAGFWDFFKQAMTLQPNAMMLDPEEMADLFSTMGTSIAVIQGLAMLVMLLIQPLYTSVMYYDLRARQGEFTQPGDTDGSIEESVIISEG